MEEKFLQGLFDRMKNSGIERTLRNFIVNKRWGSALDTSPPELVNTPAPSHITPFPAPSATSDAPMPPQPAPQSTSSSSSLGPPPPLTPSSATSSTASDLPPYTRPTTANGDEEIEENGMFYQVNPRCIFCYRRGHLSAACPKIGKKKCFKCHRKGHIRRHCPWTNIS